MNVLIVVDMQNDFIDGALGSAEAVKIVPAVQARLEAARQAGERVFFTRDTHGPDYLQTQEGRKLPVPHCIRGTAGWEISAQLPVADAEVVDKPTFGSMELTARLQALAPERVTLVGLCTDICVISNAMLLRAALPETEIVVEAACCAGVTPASHATALQAMTACQIAIL